MVTGRRSVLARSTICSATTTLQAAATQAAALGANEMYFTVEPHEHKMRAALEQQEFREVDAGVYYVRDAD